MPNHQCKWGPCKNTKDKRLLGFNSDKNIKYHLFPNPQTDIDKCRKWIKACNRPHEQLNVERISKDWARKDKSSRSYFICSNHFVGGEPTEEYPDPTSADPLSRAAAPPARKSRDKKPAEKRKRACSVDTEQHKRPCVTRIQTEAQNNPAHEPAPVPSMPTREATPHIVGITRCYSRTFPYEPQPSTSHAVDQSEAAMASEAATATSEHVLQHPMDACQHVAFTCPNCCNIFELSKEQLCSLQKPAFLQQALASDETAMHFFGFPSLSILRGTFDWLQPSAENIQLWKGKQTVHDDVSRQRSRTKLTLLDEYLLTFLRLRQNYDVDLLGILFGISPAYVTRIFYSWICFLDTAFAKPLLQYPSKETVANNLPASFKAFPTTRVIIDCFELKLQKPSRPVAQRQTWSSYKHSNTLKTLIGIMPSGAITFLSEAFGGSISDKQIVELSGLLHLIEEGDMVMADRGFTIGDLLLALKAKLNIPAFSHGKPLTKKGVQKSRNIASVRIHVERAIGRLKRFAILRGTVPLKRRLLMTKIIRICCVMCNMSDRLAM